MIFDDAFCSNDVFIFTLCCIIMLTDVCTTARNTSKDSITTWLFIYFFDPDLMHEQEKE